MRAVEVWAVAEDPLPPAWEVEAAADGGGVRSQKHAEAAAFLELAGRSALPDEARAAIEEQEAGEER